MKILILSPHVDDAELCMGGFMARHAKECHVVFYSGCDIPGVRHEVEASMKTLGVTHWFIKDHKRRYMNTEKQYILQDMTEMKHFDMVFAPHPDDCHQDHKTISDAAVRAFGRKTDLYFYLWPPNMLSVPSRLFFQLSEEELNLKVKALMSYSSQVRLRPQVFNDEFVKAHAIFQGSLRNWKYAEAFDVYRANFNMNENGM